jgi:hypothetical protein
MKKPVSAFTLRVGDLCYPRSSRPNGSFLRSEWRVGRISQEEGYILLRKGTAKRFVALTDIVLIYVDES